ncbi:MAG: hypothetical protein NT166_13400 [Candidatus Aminicenantes bacterium]|nr:hypothetical protein [Candidatus Aminicenantes bacterium]
MKKAINRIKPKNRQEKDKQQWRKPAVKKTVRNTRIARKSGPR